MSTRFVGGAVSAWMSVVLVSGCSGAGSGARDEVAGEVSPSKPTPSESFLEPGPYAEGQIVFRLDSPAFSCDDTPVTDAADAPFHCLQALCEATAGARWNGAERECECEDGGIFRTAGRKAGCVRAVAVGRTLRVGPSVTIVPEVLEVDGASRLRLGHLGGLTLRRPTGLAAPFTTLLEMALGAYGEDVQGYRQLTYHEGTLVTDPTREGRLESRLLNLAEETDVVDFLSADATEPRIGDYVEPQNPEIPSGLRLMLELSAIVLRSRYSLEGAFVSYASASGGCAAGCRLEVPLIDESQGLGFRAIFVKQYFLGAPFREYVAVTSVNGGMEKAWLAHVELSPGREVSHTLVRSLEDGRQRQWAFDFKGRPI